MKLSLRWLMLGLFSLLSGCSALDTIRSISSQEGKFFVSVDLVAAEYLNPNLLNKSFPVEVQVFLMERDTDFIRADYFEFHNQRASSITDLAKGVVIRPGTNETILFEIDEYVRYVGVVAAYQDIDNAVWRDVVQIGDGRGFIGKYLNLNNHVQLRVNLEGKVVAFEK
ncbi:type VI secretion system lipoprotein TssJ [Nitrincola sp. MINF-07-Sa-05]|uniref:type VI secretion system lipoprotein TssJ n=1 Tax=Nitrincola salilacus TaxID=3400273 RepID=UPI0039181319